MILYACPCLHRRRATIVLTLPAVRMLRLFDKGVQSLLGLYTIRRGSRSSMHCLH